MQGANKISSQELWQGTAKAAEGCLSQILWANAKDEGMNVELWGWGAAAPQSLGSKRNLNKASF